MMRASRTRRSRRRSLRGEDFREIVASRGQVIVRLATSKGGHAIFRTRRAIILLGGLGLASAAGLAATLAWLQDAG